MVHFLPIRKDQITFVSLESNQLEQDLLQIYKALDTNYRIKTVLIKFGKNTLWSNFLYMLNACKQIWYINQSAVVIINDNNYVISNFKRKGVQVIQVWHATGAIKKFGNCLEREYKIENYDYVIANSEYWIKPYSEAFGVAEQQVVVTGMPRVDKLFDEEKKRCSIDEFYKRFPQCKGKKLMLYAPTFRGNIYKGFETRDLNGITLMEKLGEEYMILYKYHPLLSHIKVEDHAQCINVNAVELYELFHVSDLLISDYSSIIFDYSLLQKPMVFYAPDLDEYKNDVGHFVDYDTMPGPICSTTDEVYDGVLAGMNEMKMDSIKEFSKQYFIHRDGCNTKRVVELIEGVILHEEVM